MTEHMLYRRLLITLIAAVCLVALPARAIGPANKLSVTPSTLKLTADQSVALVATATDTSNISADVTSVALFTTNDPRGNFTGATYNAGKVGSWTLTITYESVTATVPVTVTAGNLAELVMNPNSNPEVIALNKTAKFMVTAFDARNNKLPAPKLSWSTTGGLGTISSTGVFTPTTEGTDTVVATSGTISTNVAIKVVAVRVVATTNTSTNTNTTANTNTATNTNVSTNTNAPAETNLNVAGTTTDDTNTTNSCSSRANWLWGILLLALLGGVAILYAFIPVSKIWPGAIGLGLALVLSIIERSYGCSSNGWWPWVALIGTAALTLFAYQQSPKTPSQFPPKQPPQQPPFTPHQ